MYLLAQKPNRAVPEGHSEREWVIEDRSGNEKCSNTKETYTIECTISPSCHYYYDVVAVAPRHKEPHINHPPLREVFSFYLLLLFIGKCIFIFCFPYKF